MSEVLDHLLYTENHEWIKDNGDGTVTLGVTDHAQEVMGDIVFIELPEEGKTLTQGDECGLVESVKAASEVYTPLSGEVISANSALEGAAELINQAPYDEGWIAVIKCTDPTEREDLLSAKDYEQLIDSQ